MKGFSQMFADETPPMFTELFCVNLWGLIREHLRETPFFIFQKTDFCKKYNISKI